MEQQQERRGHLTGAEEGQSAVERLAEKIEISANARAVFGQPIERDGVTVVPVARAKWGVGGGVGMKKGSSGDVEGERGEGSGGGAVIAPIGYIELRRGGATRFRPIRSPMVSAIAWTTGLIGALFALSMIRMGGKARRRFSREKGRFEALRQGAEGSWLGRKVKQGVLSRSRD